MSCTVAEHPLAPYPHWMYRDGCGSIRRAIDNEGTQDELNPYHHSDYNTAKLACDTHRGKSLLFVSSENEFVVVRFRPVARLHFSRASDETEEAIRKDQGRIIEWLNSYGEFDPLTGDLLIWCRASIPSVIREFDRYQLKIYGFGCFPVNPGYYAIHKPIQDRQAEIDELSKQYSSDCDELRDLQAELEAEDAERLLLPANPFGTTVELIRASQIQSEPIDWLWHGWLALRKLAILAGPPGVGKSTLAYSFAAIVSSGGIWPDGTRCPQGRVFIFSTEDGAEDTIIPRLQAMRANLDWIRIIKGTSNSEGKLMPFNLSRDIPLLKAAALDFGKPSLIIVDPIYAAVKGDMNKMNEVTEGLDPLIDLADFSKCCVLGIMHFGKNTSDRQPLERLLNSIGFGAKPRIVLAAAQSTDSEQHLLVRIKLNIGPNGDGFQYTINETSITEAITGTYIAWGKMVLGTAQDLLASIEGPQISHQQIDKAKEFLLERMAHAPLVAANEIVEARTRGISAVSLHRARKQLNIDTYKDGLTGGWLWKPTTQ